MHETVCVWLDVPEEREQVYTVTVQPDHCYRVTVHNQVSMLSDVEDLANYDDFLASLPEGFE